MAADAKKVLPQQKIRTIENLSLEEFEHAVYSRNYEKAGHLLLTGLRKLKIGGEFIGYVPDPRIKPALYTRWCAAVVTLFLDAGFGVSPDGFMLFATEHATMDLLFRASAFGTSDHMLPQVSQNPSETDRTKLRLLDGPSLAKYLLTYSLRSGFALNFKATFERDPERLFPLWVGMLTPQLTTAVQAQDRRDQLLALHSLFKDVPLHDGVLPSLSDAYMYCSYSGAPHKHDMKATIHHMMARMLQQRGVSLPTSEDIAKRASRTKAVAVRSVTGYRPTMVVCLEWFTSNHAMYRCYAPAMRQLRKQFRLVGMSRESEIDEIGKAEFDEWVELPAENMVLAKVIDRITALQPAVLYYPSVGMSLWWVVLASVRLAPVQMMTLGHPASSRSPAMDIALVEEGIVRGEDIKAVFTERVWQYPQGALRFTMRADIDRLPTPVPDTDPERLHVAVPAALMKLNATFMGALRQIQQGADKPVHFHFFINTMGLNFHQAGQEIADWLGIENFTIYPRLDYAAYMEKLNQCHLQLCTFPFGGTNSNIDALLLGIPPVTLEGREPHERYDAVMFDRLGLPSRQCVAADIESYVLRAVTLLNDSVARRALRAQIQALDVPAEFFGEGEGALKTAFADIAWAAFTEKLNEIGT